MNIKRNTFAVLAAAVLLASCSQDEVMTASPDGLVPVTLSAAVGDGVQTRTATEGEAKRCVIQILEKNGDGWSDAIGLGLEKNPIDVEPDVNNPAQFTLTDVLLNPDKEYTFLFWADEDKGFYDASNLKNVKIVNGNATNIAWQGKATWDKTGSSITAELTHAVAKVTLQSTTAVESGRKFVLSNLREYNGFDVMNGTANGDIVTPGHEGTGTGALGDLLSFYALVTDENQELKLTSGEGGGVVSISNVPLAPNTHVILKGNVQDAGWTTVNFTTSVDEIWSNDENVDILGYNYDADNNTYNVTSEEGLRAMAELVNSGETGINITLAKDITLTEVWTPIGNSSNPYTGTFDGNAHAISGLTIDQSGTRRVGLIGYIGLGGAVKNLKLTNVNVSGYMSVGAVAGWSNGTISGCSVSGNIKGSQSVGGVVGNANGNVTDCSVEGMVIGTNKISQAGGIVGVADKTHVTECHSSAIVEGISYVGGIVGMGTTGSNITACYATGEVKATIASGEAYAGGVVGRITNYATVTACYATGNVTATQGRNAGGVVGASEGSTITACYHATGTVSGSARVGGVLGYNNAGTVTACYWQNYQSQGIGENQVGTAETTKVEDNWAAAIDKMNEALAIQNINWRYVQADGSSLPPVLKTAI